MQNKIPTSAQSIPNINARTPICHVKSGNKMLSNPNPERPKDFETIKAVSEETAQGTIAE